MSTPIKRNQPIGVFDSGLGGLTVVKELIRTLPHEDIIYFGDTARVPYGTKSREAIIRFSKENVALLLKFNVKAVVVACNTSSSVALPSLRQRFSVPIIDVIDPGAKKAVAITRSGKIGVIATQATVNSRSYVKRIKFFDRRVKVTAQPCPLFVPLAEEGWFDKKVSREIAEEYLKTLKVVGVDTLILGCTHYPLLKAVIQKVMGPRVTLVDSAKIVAQKVKDVLKQHHLERLGRRHVRHQFFVSDEPKHFQILAKRFLGKSLKNVKRLSHV